MGVRLAKERLRLDGVTAMGDKDTLNEEKLQTKKDKRQQQIKALMDSKVRNLEDKIASLRTANQLDKGRIQSALSEMMKSK